jgi:hypothetical protein
MTTAQIGASVGGRARVDCEARRPDDRCPGIVGRILVTLLTKGFDMRETVEALKRVRMRISAPKDL